MLESRLKPFFSVVIPVHNKKPHIKRCLDSVFKQTFSNFEILLIDDASNDGGEEYIKSIVDPRIRLFYRSNPGPGGYAARNLGIREARAEWIAFLDADDEWHPHHLEKMADLSRLFPDAGFLSCGWCDVYPGGIAINDAYFQDQSGRSAHIISLSDYLENVIQKRRPVYTSVAVMAKREATDIFPDGQVKRGGDLYAFLHLAARVKMAWSPHIGASYFRDSINMVTRHSPGSSKLADIMFDAVKNRVCAADLSKLKQYRNRLLWGSFVTCRSLNGETFSLASRFYWKGDFWFCFQRSCLALFLRLLPAGAIASLRRLKTSIKRL